MKTSLKEYISTLDLDAEQKKLLEPLLANEKVCGKIDAELAGAQSELSRKFDEAKKAKEATDKYREELVGWKTDAEKKFGEAEQTARKATETLAQYKARLTSLVAAGDLDEEDVKDLLTAEPAKADLPAKKDDPPRDHDGRFISRDDYQKDATNFVRLPAQINDLAAKHLELFGKPISNMDELVGEALTSKRPLTDVWKEKFKVGDREKELADARQKEHDDLIRRDERQKVLSEVSNPAVRPTGAASPVLAQFPGNKDVVRREGTNGGVMAAVAAYEQGKYRDQGGERK